jgi:hypothetical protein
MYKENNKQSLEKYSSAVTLSDMEVFIFPELIYSLFLANCMSPRMWQWKTDPWFGKLEKMNPNRRIQRLKQFIMDNFSFNLDLDTWGLTTKQRELARFDSFIDESVLAESNALFGYEGDKYYFDIDIRKHFGLDKYTSDIIPYWKTETLEAMEAFRYKEGYPNGAGECVSLAALYASAAFVVTEVPLDDIYMMATPLHSQNFLDINDGIITNNRRIVTKTMWFNGTELSSKARRALENERVTIVSHHSGYIHTIYDIATIDQDRYKHFRDRLHNYLKTPITFEILANFLRQSHNLQRCFQIAHSCCGKPRYIEAEKVFHYEHSSKSRVGDKTQAKLLHEIEEDEYYPEPLPNRIVLEELEAFFRENRVFVDETSTLEKLKQYLRHSCYNVEEVVHDLIGFCRISPRLPDPIKNWNKTPPIDVSGVSTAEEMVACLESQRNNSETIDLAFTAFRDLSRSAWKPFLKAALERNPVCINGTSNMTDIDDVYSQINTMENYSIYDFPTRLAQPDEVWNYGRGDGLEKALCFLNILKARYPDDRFTFDYSDSAVRVKDGKDKEYTFQTTKKLLPPAEKDFESE